MAQAKCSAPSQTQPAAAAGGAPSTLLIHDSGQPGVQLGLGMAALARPLGAPGRIETYASLPRLIVLT